MKTFLFSLLLCSLQVFAFEPADTTVMKYPKSTVMDTLLSPAFYGTLWDTSKINDGYGVCLLPAGQDRLIDSCEQFEDSLIELGLAALIDSFPGCKWLRLKEYQKPTNDVLEYSGRYTTNYIIAFAPAGDTTETGSVPIFRMNQRFRQLAAVGRTTLTPATWDTGPAYMPSYHYGTTEHTDSWHLDPTSRVSYRMIVVHHSCRVGMYADSLGMAAINIGEPGVLSMPSYYREGAVGHHTGIDTALWEPPSDFSTLSFETGVSVALRCSSSFANTVVSHDAAVDGSFNITNDGMPAFGHSDMWTNSSPVAYIPVGNITDADIANASFALRVGIRIFSRVSNAVQAYNNAHFWMPDVSTWTGTTCGNVNTPVQERGWTWQADPAPLCLSPELAVDQIYSYRYKVPTVFGANHTSYSYTNNHHGVRLGRIWCNTLSNWLQYGYPDSVMFKHEVDVTWVDPAQSDDWTYPRSHVFGTGFMDIMVTREWYRRWQYAE